MRTPWSNVLPVINSVSRDCVIPGGRVDADQLAVAQHGDAARNLQHFGEAMADEDDRHALGRERSHDVEQPVGLGLGERGRRLVHENDFGITGERARDGNDLALRDGKGPKRRIDIEIGAEPRKQPVARRCAWRRD